ncbi:MAG TPA: MgtC/SapB family protein [Gemmatimonadales bacterium]|nr:MgtC/SapB family protein [Gemmatimonadales bacterium]
MMPGLADAIHLPVLLQLGLAVLLGGAIGLERELAGKPAGLRTNILICVGATLFTLMSIQLAFDGPGHGDPTRVAAQIVTGVGFIGAGTILHARGAVTGLTSAATIWVVAAIGIAVGRSAYVDALGTTALVMVVLYGLGYVERFAGRHSTRSHLLIHARPEPNALEELEILVRRAGVEVERTESRRENVDLVVELDLRGPRRLHEQAMISILHHPLVRTVSTGE